MLLRLADILSRKLEGKLVDEFEKRGHRRPWILVTPEKLSVRYYFTITTYSLRGQAYTGFSNQAFCTGSVSHQKKVLFRSIKN